MEGSSKATSQKHLEKTLEFVKQQQQFATNNGEIELNGKGLTVPMIYALSSSKGSLQLQISNYSQERMQLNAKYLEEKVSNEMFIFYFNKNFL